MDSSNGTRDRRFAGRSVLVTGASEGIGKATARMFAALGARVAINARREDALREVLAELPPASDGDHLAVAGDMAVEADVAQVMKTCIDHFGGLDILICNAGLMRNSPSDEITAEDISAVISVNMTSVIFCARAALHHWRAHNTHGVILVNSSVHERIPKPQYLAYSASKGAVGNIVRTLALEYAGHGIRVNGVAPGAIVTPMNAAWTDDPEKRAVISSHIPLGRPGEADEIASAFAFLASDEARYITGQTLYVDGGLTLYADFEKNWSS